MTDGQEGSASSRVRSRNAELDKPVAAAEGEGGGCYAECETKAVVYVDGGAGRKSIAVGGRGSLVTRGA
jgi:hypothetical protein